MKLSDENTIILHELYHRREDGRIVLGRPESGEFLVITPAEYEAVRLLQRHLSLGHVKELMIDQRIVVDLDSLIVELRAKGFVHKIDNRIDTPLHEPLHQVHLHAAWLGGTTAPLMGCKMQSSA